MPACEKCWADAARIAFRTDRSQTDCYMELLEERKDHPCSEEEQKGIEVDHGND